MKITASPLFRFGLHALAAAYLLATVSFNQAYSQSEVEAWGNFTGIRVNGQLMEFESNLQLVSTDWQHIQATALERQRPKFTRQQNTQVIATQIDSFHFVESVEDTGEGIAKVTVQFTATKNTDAEALYFNLKLPGADYANGTIKLTNPQKGTSSKYDVADLNNDLKVTADGVKFKASLRQLDIHFDGPTQIIIKKKNEKGIEKISVYIPLQSGAIHNGQTGQAAFIIKASGKVDKNPVKLQLDTAATGRQFLGLGGNFRIQNPKTDPQVIDYCLQNLRVAWGRVEMPWSAWQPVKNSNPIDTAKAGRLNPRVQRAMDMAQRLNQQGIPVVLTAWFPPRWAAVGELNFRPKPNGVWGNQLNDDSTEAIYKSITDYIVYLKEHYGTEVKLFSFNESDLGINVRQTGEEHAKLIKGLGAYMAARGLATKMLLGDNSDATSYKFIYPAMKDTATYPYIGAISFHSWRGWDRETLQKWADAAKQLNRPLLVGEGSIDAAAWAYPAIFQEQIYALKEINLYTRLMAICQPASILQWQLTADYSPLAGGGIFGDNGPLRPIRRFYNLKQLSSVPANLYAMPITTNSANISCAAQGDNGKGKYAIHIVNNGAARTVTITGLPTNVKSLRIYTTSATLNMLEGRQVKVANGHAKFTADAASYVTLVSE